MNRILRSKRTWVVVVVMVGLTVYSVKRRETIDIALNLVGQKYPDASWWYEHVDVTFNGFNKRTVRGLLTNKKPNENKSYTDPIEIVLEKRNGEWVIAEFEGNNYQSLFDRTERFLRRCLGLFPL